MTMKAGAIKTTTNWAILMTYDSPLRPTFVRKLPLTAGSVDRLRRLAKQRNIELLEEPCQEK